MDENDRMLNNRGSHLQFTLKLIQNVGEDLNRLLVLSQTVVEVPTAQSSPPAKLADRQSLVVHFERFGEVAFSL